MANETTLTSAEQKELAELRKFKATAAKREMEAQGITDEYQNYKPGKGEDDAVHLLVRKPAMMGGVDVSKPELQIFGQSVYLRNILPNWHALGYKLLKVLHMPKGPDKKTLPTPDEYAKAKAEQAAKK